MHESSVGQTCVAFALATSDVHQKDMSDRVLLVFVKMVTFRILMHLQ